MASSSADIFARASRDSVVTSPDLLVVSQDDERTSTQVRTPTPETTTTASPCTLTLMSPSVFLASHEEMFPCDLVELINVFNDSDADVESGSAAAPSSSSSVACDAGVVRSHEYSSSIANNREGQAPYWQNQSLYSAARRAFWCGDSCRLPDAREIARCLDELNRALRATSTR